MEINLKVSLLITELMEKVPILIMIINIIKKKGPGRIINLLSQFDKSLKEILLLLCLLYIYFQ